MDAKRRFILSYFLSNDMISIYEPPVRNSGIIGGKYLGKTRVAKPGSTTENAVYYGPSDLTIGSTIEGKIWSGLVILSEHWLLLPDLSFIAQTAYIPSIIRKICTFWISLLFSFHITCWCELM